jgi:hypothetical protein
MLDQIDVQGLINLEWLAKGLTSAKPGNLFPSNVARTAVNLSNTFLQVLEAGLATGYRPRRIDVVQVPKWDTTTRPASDMPIADEVIYSSLAEYLKEHVHPGLVTFTGLHGDGQSYEAFEQYPLTVPDTQYVLEADASSFYEYIDHERLMSELVGLTGEAAISNALLGLLEGWLGAAHGIPQGPSASAILADIYISPVSRALSRAGFMHSRYSDDFKVVATTWDEVRRAQLLLERALREVGLVIAIGKLRTPGIETYQEILDLVEEGEQEYGPDEDEQGPLTAEEVEAEVLTIRNCLAQPKVTIEWTRLVRRSLAKLGRAGSERALVFVPRLLNSYPHITQSLSAYVRSLMTGVHEEAALNVVVSWLKSTGFRYPWQIGWVLHAASFAESPQASLADWSSPVLFNDSFPWFVRGQAAISIAVHGRLPPQQSFFNVYEAAPQATKPDLVAAVVVGSPRWKGQFMAGMQIGPVLAATALLEPGEYRRWI